MISKTIYVHLVAYDNYAEALASASVFIKFGVEIIVFCDRSAMNHWLALMRHRPGLTVKALKTPDCECLSLTRGFGQTSQQEPPPAG
jgi:hypothetical protein